MYLCIFLKEHKLLIPSFHQTCLTSEVYIECSPVLSSVKEQSTTRNWKLGLDRSEFLEFIKGLILQTQPITSNSLSLLILLIADIIVSNTCVQNWIQGCKNHIATPASQHSMFQLNRIMEKLRLEKTWRSSSLNTSSAEGQVEQVVHGHIQSASECLQGWTVHNLLGQFARVNTRNKDFFSLIFNRYFLFSDLCLFSLVLPLKMGGPVFFNSPAGHLFTPIRTLLKQSQLISFCSQPLPICQVDKALNFLCGPFLDSLQCGFVSVVPSGPALDPALQMDLVGTEQRVGMPALDLVTRCCRLFLPEGHIAGLCSIWGPPGHQAPFPRSCFTASPQPVPMHGAIPPERNS